MTNPPKRTFLSPEAFRTSLESKLQQAAREQGQDLQRIRRKVAFERMLARLFAETKRDWLLKGGHAMELRFSIARATQDIDLTIQDPLKLVRSNQTLQSALQAAVSIGLTETIVLEGWLAPYGFPPVSCSLANAEQQFAEKRHVYTLPRPAEENSRAKDLIDLVLLAQSDRIDNQRLSRSIREIFDRRGTHDLPSPPARWLNPFGIMGSECNMTLSIAESIEYIQEYLASHGR